MGSVRESNEFQGLAFLWVDDTRAVNETVSHVIRRSILLSCKGALNDQSYLTMIFFNDKISPANISFLTRYGWVVWRYLFF